jgi:uncharacterized protein (DUF488 family)
MPELFTIGHSTHSLEDFLALLRTHGIERLVDVRIAPGSRRFPHFAGDRLARALPADGVEYVHARALGGRRRPLPGSPNTGWRTAAFRGYADHMRTEEFEGALRELEGLARERRTAIMCAEALWWRCHRRLIADALVARGWRVTHIASDGALAAHELPPFAEIDSGHVAYPGGPRQLEL